MTGQLVPSFEIYPGDTGVQTTSLAISPVDAVTGRGGGIELRVRMVDEGRAVRNLSGYYCFLDAPDGDHTVRITPAGPDRFRYLAREIPVTLPHADPLRPVQNVRIYPSTAYPFEASATLVRGRVESSLSGQPLSDVAIQVFGRPEADTRSDGKGLFVLDAKPEQPTETVSIVFEKDGLSTSRVVSLEEGKTANLGVVNLPLP